MRNTVPNSRRFAPQDNVVADQRVNRGRSHEADYTRWLLLAAFAVLTFVGLLFLVRHFPQMEAFLTSLLPRR